MEPNKIEKQFKEQLNSREIKPSEMAWDKLDAMITVADTKPKRNFRWFYIAASILGFLLISNMYFNHFDNVKINKDTPIVLEQKTEGNNLEEPKIINEGVLPDKIQNKTITLNTVATDDNIPKNNSKQLDNKVDKVLITNQSKDNVVVDSSEKDNKQSISKYKYTSAEKLLAEVSDAKFETKTAEEKIRKTRKSISVNPNDLLLNAETELNQSFRESALDRFNKKLNAVKTVLVNRNYEE